ncbi:hypothetical protein [Mycolicibacterium peregrinum]|nr:hypothetical protein [Mycolicibacterium peregrinum]
MDMTMRVILPLAALAALTMVIAVQLFRLRGGGASRQRHAGAVISGNLQLVCAVLLATSAVKHTETWRLFNVAAAVLCLCAGFIALRRGLKTEPRCVSRFRSAHPGGSAASSDVGSVHH